MSQNITFNGNGYVIPDLGEINWGQNLTDFFVSIPAGALQPTGGGFTLTAEVDFGGAFGLKSLYFKSRTTNPAAAGVVRLANADTISFRNAANSADLTLGVNGSNQLTFNGVVLESDTLPDGQIFIGNASNSSTPNPVTGDISITNTGVVAISSGVIVNADVNASAAIDYSKLNLLGGIVNADVNAAAAIAYSKLNLSASIVNADVNASAAIAYSKLNLSGSIVNADVNASAAIALSKLATVAVNRVLRSSSGGLIDVTGWTYGTITADWQESVSSTGIYFRDSGGTNRVGISAPASVTSHNYLLPIAAGTAGQVLSWQSGGQMQWINAAGGGTINTGAAGFFSYYPANGTTLDDQTVFSTNGTTQVYFIDGSAGVPSLSFAADTDTGFYRVASGAIDFASNGAATVRFQAGGIEMQAGIIQNTFGSAAAPSFTFDGDEDSGLYRSAVDNLSITTAGVLRWTIDQNGTMFAGTTQGIQFPAGSVSIPAANCASDTDTGVYFPSANAVAISCGATQSLLVDATSTYHRQGSANTPGLTFIADDNTGIYSISADVLGFSTAGVFRGAFNSLGYFGVGALPSFALHVQRSVSDTTNRMVISNTNGTAAQERRSFITAIGDNLNNEISLIAGKDATNLAYEMLGGTTMIQFGTGGSEKARMTSTGAFDVGDGTAALPSLSFLSDTNTGIYRISSDRIGISAGGNLLASLQLSAFDVSGSTQFLIADGTAAAPAVALSNNTDTGLYRVSSQRLGISTAGVLRWDIDGAAVVTHTYATAGGTTFLDQVHTDNTNSLSHSIHRLRTGGASGGDPLINFLVQGVTNFSLGIDNSDSDKFKIAGNNALGSNDWLIIDTSGNIALGPNATTGPAFSFQDNGTSDLRFLLYKNNATGDPYTNWSTNATNWSMGIDNSDGDVLNITEASTLGGANTRLRMPTGGQFQVGDGSAAAPQYSFINDTDSGWYSAASNEIACGLGGAERFRINTANGANDIRFQCYDHTGAAMKQVSRGAADSGGAGFRVLRIPN